MRRSVRMSDIAQRMGISMVSVSKTLAGKPGISKDLRGKIVAAAREMGYTRLRRAPGMTGNIGVLVMDRLFSENNFYTKLYRALVRECGDEGYTCIVEFLSEQMKEDGVMPTLLMRRMVDGIIFMGEIPQPYVEAVAVGLPCLTLDFQIPNLAMDSVVRDNIGGGRVLTEHLLSSGYRSIGFAGDIHRSYNGLTRYLGYQWAMCQFGFDPNDGWRLEQPEEILRRAEFPAGLPEAFVCASKKLAVELTQVLEMNGSHAAAVCFDDHPVPLSGKGNFAAYHVDAARMAEEAVRQILCRIREEDGGVVNCVVPGCLIR